jgi:hypothetical protein
LTAIENKGNRVYVTEEVQFKLSKLKNRREAEITEIRMQSAQEYRSEREGDEESRYQVRDFYLRDAASSLGSISGRSALLAAPPHLGDPVKSATRRETNRDCPVRVSLTINFLSYS